MRGMQIDRLALSFCPGSEGESCREELRAIILPKERLMYAEEGDEDERKEHFYHRDVQWTPLERRVKYNHTNALLFSRTAWKILLHLRWKLRKRKRQSRTFICRYAYLHISIGCFVDDNYLLEYRIPKTSHGNEGTRRKDRKKSGGMQRR